MPNTHFRFIAYQVPTAAEDLATRDVVPAFAPGTEIAADRFAPIRVDDTLQADARIRLKRLAAAVKSASDMVRRGVKGVPDGPHVLKVFVVPEFYFRPPGTRHCTYPYAVAMQLFEQMDVMFNDPEFENWLFVLGTVMWHWREGGIDFRNSAVHVRGNQVDSLRIIEKEVPSHIDGVPNPYAKGKVGDADYDPYLKQIFADWWSRKNHVFDIGGVSCGLEVCLDHAYWDDDAVGGNHRVLKTVLSDWPGMPAPDVQLHVLTAGGMEIDRRSVAAMRNGYILRNDGFSNDPQTELHLVGLYHRENALRSVVPASDLRGAANLAALRPDGFLGFPDDQQIPIDKTKYSSFDQGLKFFPVRQLPAL